MCFFNDMYVVLSLLTDLSSGLLTFAHYGYKDSTDAQVHILVALDQTYFICDLLFFAVIHSHKTGSCLFSCA